MGEAGGEDGLNVVAVALGEPLPGTGHLVQEGEHGGPDVFAYHQGIAEVELGRFNRAIQQAQGVGKVGSVVAGPSGIGEVDGHAVTTPCPSGPLPIVGRKRRHVPHQHRIEGANVDAHFEGGGADEGIDQLALALKDALDAIPLILGHLGRVFFGAQHGKLVIQHPQVVVIGVFGFKGKGAPAAPGGAGQARRGPRMGTAANATAVDASTGGNFQPIGINLIHPFAAL